MKTSIPLVIGFSLLAAACSGSPHEGTGRQSNALTELVLDAHFEASGATSDICFVGAVNTFGQQFVPSQDNVAAASFRVSGWGPAIDDDIDVRILDSAYAVLAATTVPVTMPVTDYFDPAIIEVYAEFNPPVSVVPGETYVLQGVLPPSTFEGGLAWLDGRDNSYPDGIAVSWCPDNQPQLMTDNWDFDFATYASVEVSEPTVDEILDEVDPAPASGQMTGPNDRANAGRLAAFQNMIDDAEALFAAGDTEQGCAKLAAAENKVSAWFAGETAAALLEALAALAEENGCG